jgi:hypothetical protein
MTRVHFEVLLAVTAGLDPEGDIAGAVLSGVDPRQVQRAASGGGIERNGDETDACALPLDRMGEKHDPLLGESEADLPRGAVGGPAVDLDRERAAGFDGGCRERHVRKRLRAGRGAKAGGGHSDR